MQTSLRGIAKRAAANPGQRFGNLYGLLNERNLHWCLRRVNRKAAPGVDGVDYATYAKDAEANIGELAAVLKEKRYRARLVRRHYIPKGNGKRRPLGIPVVADKVVQTGAAEILMAIYESDFLDCSHGYRRGRGPRSAALQLGATFQRGRYRWVVDADIKGFFDNIDHDWMIRMLEERIDDRAFLGLIRKWLKAGILEEDGQVVNPTTGTPQGGIVSAVLANIYLHYALDLWFEKVVKPQCRGDACMMRYADDFVSCFQLADDAHRFHASLGPRLAKFHLTLSAEKTKLLRFTRFETKGGNIFNFLGFEYRWGTSRKGNPLLRLFTSKDKYRQALRGLKIWLRTNRCKMPVSSLLNKLTLKLRGHYNYYGVCGNSPRLWSYYHEVVKLLFKWLNRRSQRKSYNWEGFMEMLKYFNIPRPRIIAYWD